MTTAAAQGPYGSASLLVSDAPTAVAISTLDVCRPAMDTQSTDYYEHWGLTHFLLDGHHKMHAAAEAHRPLRLLSLLSTDESLAKAEQVATAVKVRAHPPWRPRLSGRGVGAAPNRGA